jgi:hypothetical protein
MAPEYQRGTGSGQAAPEAAVAIARELAEFAWAEMTAA